MKAIMISIKPKWCAKIMNGDKTIEVRTSKALANAIQKLIDKYGHADIYGYCTKDKSRDNDGNVIGRCFPPQVSLKVIGGRGKVVFKFRCYKVEEIDHWYSIMPCFKQTRLSPQEFDNYIGSEIGYAIQISDLEIFNKPKELSEFTTPRKLIGYGMSCNYYSVKTLTKAPQNFCYVEE